MLFVFVFAEGLAARFRALLFLHFCLLKEPGFALRWLPVYHFRSVYFVLISFERHRHQPRRHQLIGVEAKIRLADGPDLVHEILVFQLLAEVPIRVLVVVLVSVVEAELALYLVKQLTVFQRVQFARVVRALVLSKDRPSQNTLACLVAQPPQHRVLDRLHSNIVIYKLVEAGLHRSRVGVVGLDLLHLFKFLVLA